MVLMTGAANEGNHAMGYDSDQVRYFLALLGLTEKPSDFDLPKFEERNRVSPFEKLRMS